MMRTFTQRILACVAVVALMSSGAMAQTESFMVVNSPDDIAGDYSVRLAAFGAQDVMTLTGDLLLGEDGTDPVNDGCEALVNDVSGKIAVIDRGTCAFVDKANNANAAGAIALLVCNNQDGDPIVMTGDAPDVTIPCYMASQADCEVIKMSMASGTVNVTFEERARECPVTYGPEVFWGHEPGQGDFSVPFSESGWQSVNTEPLDRDDVQWSNEADGTPLHPEYFGSGDVLDSPSECNGTAQFSFVGYAVADGNLSQPYTTYGAELISPIIDCSGKEFVVLDFYQAYNRLNGTCRFAYSIDGGDTWETMDVEHLGVVNEEVDMRKVSLPLGALDNQPNCRIKFIASGDFYYWNIDDVVMKSGKIYDIRAEPDFYATAPNYLAPYHQADAVPFLIDLRNTGNQDLDVEVKVEVSKDGNIVHEQTLPYGIVEAGADADNRAFPQMYTPDAGVGEYTIKYTVISNSGDDDDANNTQETTFILTDEDPAGTIMSKLPIDYANLGNWGIPGEHNRSFGNFYRFPNGTAENGAMYTLDTVYAGISQDEDNIDMLGFLEAHVYKWIDLNDDRICNPAERTQIGTGTLFDIANGVTAIPLNDVNDEDAKVMLDLQDGEGIIVMLHMNSFNTGVTWRPRAISAPGETLNSVATVLAYDSLGVFNFMSMDATGSSFDDVATRNFEASGQLTYYTPISLSTVNSTSNEFNETFSLNVFPNPTAELLNVNFNFEEQMDYAAIQITDNTGKFVRGMKYDNISAREVSIDVSDLNAGMYNVVIQTPKGFTSKQFTVVK